MPKRASKTQDLNQIAADILIDAVGNPPPLTPAGKKNPAAMKLVPAAGVQLDPEKVVTHSPSKRTKTAKKSAPVEADRKLTRKPG